MEQERVCSMKYGMKWLAAALAVSMLFAVAGCKPKEEAVNNPSEPSGQEEVTKPIDPAIQEDVDLLIARYVLPYETTLRGQAFSSVSQLPDRLLYRYAVGIMDSVFVSEDFLLTDLKGENSYHAIPDDLITEIVKLDFDLDGFLYNKALYYDDSQGVYDRGNWYVIEGTTEVFPREAKLLDNGNIWILVGRRAGNHDLDSSEYVFKPVKAKDLTYVDLKSIRSDEDCNYSFVSVTPRKDMEDYAKVVEISTTEQLVELSQLVSSGDTTHGAYTYRLTGDLDMEGVEFSPIGILPQGDEETSEGSSHPFQGVFDGQGYTIQNLTIHLPDQSSVGLFANIGEHGLVKNLNLENCSIQGDGQVGALAGSSSGDVIQCTAKGEVKGSVEVGGLIGSTYGNRLAQVSYCQFDGSVTGTQSVGGLIGGPSGSDISHSYANGQLDVVASEGFENGMHIGGLVGMNNCSYIDSSLASVEIKTQILTKSVGRFLGYNNYGDVTNCYFNSAVAGSWPAASTKNTGTHQITGLSEQDFAYKLEQLIFPGK